MRHIRLAENIPTNNSTHVFFPFKQQVFRKGYKLVRWYCKIFILFILGTRYYLLQKCFQYTHIVEWSSVLWYRNIVCYHSNLSQQKIYYKLVCVVKKSFFCFNMWIYDVHHVRKICSHLVRLLLYYFIL